jgi:hypothetical protein
MTTPAQALDELPTYTMSSRAPLDALARLAAAAGYGESPTVTVAEAEGLLRLIAAIAKGTPKPAQRLRRELSPTEAQRVELRMIDDLASGGVVWGLTK